MSAPTMQRSNSEIAHQARKPVTYDARHIEGIVDSIRNLHNDGFTADQIHTHLEGFLGFTGITERWFVDEVISFL